MIEKIIKIKDEIGFHARTSSLFAKQASAFQSEIFIEFNDKKRNGKSTLALMTLGVKSQDVIKICANGIDEIKALKTLEELIKNNFKT
jgi:phosphotransferase system HPr (HPr) family protein